MMQSLKCGLRNYFSAGRIFFIILLCGGTGLAHGTEYERRQLLFGNVEVKIVIAGNIDSRQAAKLISQEFVRMRALENVFSTYNKDSVIEKFNKDLLTPGAHRIPDDIFEALQYAVMLNKMTYGGFDPTFEMPRPCPRCLKIVGRQLITKKPVRINLTGLAKGYIVDQVVHHLKQNKSIHKIVVAASGDIRVWSKKSPEVVLINNPTPFKVLNGMQVSSQEAAISTSGFYERGRHIRDTTMIGHENLQVSVIAKECFLSDGLATALMFQNEKVIAKIVRDNPGLKVMTLQKNGGVEWFIN